MPLWHALSGPVDRIFVLNVSAAPASAPMRSPLDVVMTSFMHARNQRYELERRHTIAHVDIIVLPARATRASCSTSPARRAHREAYELSMVKLDEYERELEAAHARSRPRRRPTTRPHVREQRRRFRLRRGA